MTEIVRGPRPVDLPADVLERAQKLTQGLPRAPWWWGGNIGHHSYDICLHAREPGYGHIDVLRPVRNPVTREERLHDWETNQDILSDYFDDFQAYLASFEETPERESLGFISDKDHGWLEIGRNLAVFEVARNQGLPDDTPRDHDKIYRHDVVAIRNNTAEFIAQSRGLVDDLMAEVTRLREYLTSLGDDEKGHIVRFDAESGTFNAQHPLHERVGNMLLDCNIHEEVCRFADENIAEGTWRVWRREEVEGEESNEWPWLWERA